MNKSIIKYPMKKKTERPKFNYLVRVNSSMDYYLFNEFDEAYMHMKNMSLTDSCHIACLYEPYFDTKTREYFGQNTFTAYDGEVVYDKHAKVELHLEFYVNAGEWMNPIESWLVN